MQGYDVVLFVLALAKTVTPAGVPGGAGADRTADHLTFFFSQKVLAVQSGNCIYRPVRNCGGFNNLYSELKRSHLSTVEQEWKSTRNAATTQEA